MYDITHPGFPNIWFPLGGRGHNNDDCNQRCGVYMKPPQYWKLPHRMANPNSAMARPRRTRHSRSGSWRSSLASTAHAENYAWSHLQTEPVFSSLHSDNEINSAVDPHSRPAFAFDCRFALYQPFHVEVCQSSWKG